MFSYEMLWTIWWNTVVTVKQLLLECITYNNKRQQNNLPNSMWPSYIDKNCDKGTNAKYLHNIYILIYLSNNKLVFLLFETIKKLTKILKRIY